MSLKQRDIQLGLCCMNMGLREHKPSIFASRTMRIKTLDEKGIDELKKRVHQNLDDLLKLIHWNNENNIYVFRLSSDMFPHMSNPMVPFYGFDFAKEKLALIGKTANDYGQRLTFHPGQYNVLGTPKLEFLEKTLVELDRHAEILDLMGQGKNGVMVIHGGGLYGDKQETMERWVEGFGKLSISAAERLVLENCEKCFTVRDCLTVSNMVYEKYGMSLPVVVDSHHYTCYNRLHPDVIQEPMCDMIPEVLQTWSDRGIKPKFHISEQGKGRIGHHSDLVEVIPDYMLEIPEKYDTAIDIMIEAKHKEKSIKHLYEKYDQLF